MPRVRRGDGSDVVEGMVILVKKFLTCVLCHVMIVFHNTMVAGFHNRWSRYHNRLSLGHIDKANRHLATCQKWMALWDATDENDH